VFLFFEGVLLLKIRRYQKVLFHLASYYFLKIIKKQLYQWIRKKLDRKLGGGKIKMKLKI